jgi:hypothetical protein
LPRSPTTAKTRPRSDTSFSRPSSRPRAAAAYKHRPARPRRAGTGQGGALVSSAPTRGRADRKKGAAPRLDESLPVARSALPSSLAAAASRHAATRRRHVLVPGAAQPASNLPPTHRPGPRRQMPAHKPPVRRQVVVRGSAREHDHGVRAPGTARRGGSPRTTKKSFFRGRTPAPCPHRPPGAAHTPRRRRRGQTCRPRPSFRRAAHDPFSLPPPASALPPPEAAAAAGAFRRRLASRGRMSDRLTWSPTRGRGITSRLVRAWRCGRLYPFGGLLTATVKPDCTAHAGRHSFGLCCSIGFAISTAQNAGRPGRPRAAVEGSRDVET